MSHMCIDATTRAASDFGYKTTVVHDACATREGRFGPRIANGIGVVRIDGSRRHRAREVDEQLLDPTILQALLHLVHGAHAHAMIDVSDVADFEQRGVVGQAQQCGHRRMVTEAA